MPLMDKCVSTRGGAAETPRPTRPRPKGATPKTTTAKAAQKDYDLAEAVLLKVTQFKTMLATVAQFDKLGTKDYAALCAKVEARLTPELTSLYSQGYAGGSSSTKGMPLLEDLQTQDGPTASRCSRP